MPKKDPDRKIETLRTQNQELLKICKENYNLLHDILKDRINTGAVIKTSSLEPIIIEAYDNILRAVQYEGQNRNPEFVFIAGHSISALEPIAYINDKTNEDVEFLVGSGKTQDKIDCSNKFTQFLKGIQQQPFQIYDDILDIYEDVYVVSEPLNTLDLDSLKEPDNQGQQGFDEDYEDGDDFER